MRQIVIQKQFLFLVEVAENIWRLFLVIVNFVVDIKDKVENAVADFTYKVANYFKALFGFSIYKLAPVCNINQIYSSLKVREYKNDFINYSNSLAPPSF